MTRWMRLAVLALAGTALMCWSGVANAKTLKAGDAAPPLKIAEWVKGTAFDPSKGDKDTVYVVEFWATWCGPCRVSIPHLSEIQEYFGPKRVQVVGVSDEKAGVVKSFLAKWDKKMRYAVAIDDDRATNELWMESAGAQGIPTAFLVKAGKIEWIGHPLEMDEPLAKLTGDKGWAARAAEAAEREKKKEPLIKKARAAMGEEKWDDALAALDELGKLDPKEPRYLLQRYFIHATYKKDAAAAAKLGSRIVSDVDDVDILAQVAADLMVGEMFDGSRDHALALQLADKASKLSGQNDANVLAVLAMAQFENGKVEDAIRTQKQALAGMDDEEGKAQFREQLAKFEAARAGGKASPATK